MQMYKVLLIRGSENGNTSPSVAQFTKKHIKILSIFSSSLFYIACYKIVNISLIMHFKVLTYYQMFSHFNTVWFSIFS